MSNTAKTIKDYKSKTDYRYPSDNINPELKDNKEYHLAFAQAFLSDFANNRFHFNFEKTGTSEYSIDELRAYATGMEGEARVKKNFFGEKKRDLKTGKYPTSMNIDWNGIDVMPKMFDVMRAVNMDIEFKTTARAIDEVSIQAKNLDREYLKNMIDRRTKDLLEKTKYHPNAPVSLEDIGAETEADVDLYFDSGAYITQREIASDACVSKSRHESGYRTNQSMWMDDVITLGVQIGKNYIDKANKIAKTRYCDPKYTLFPFSKFLDHRNVTKVGEYREITIGELREEYPHIEEWQWKVIARQYANQQSVELQAAIGGTGYFSREVSNDYGQNYINSCKILILDIQWLTNDMSKRLINENNEDVYREVEYGYEVDKKFAKRGHKTITKNHVKKHYCSWIIGTDTLLDFGQEDAVYYGKDGNRIPGLDFFIEKTGNKSLVERCIPHIEDIKLAVVKKRNAIATLPPAPRMIIQAQLFDNVFLNEIKQTPEMLLDLFKEKGVLVVNNLDDFNKPIFQNAKAIDFVPTGVIEDITLFSNEIIQGIERIREVTGLNQSVDASTPNSYVGLGKSQMAAAAANNALKPTFDRYVSFITRIDADLVKKWQLIAKWNKGLTLTHAPLGINTMQVLELGEDFTNAEIGIYTEMEYTNDEKQQLFGQIIELNKSYISTQGTFGLNTAEFMHLQDLINAGSFKFAKYVIARTEKKREMFALRTKRQSEEFTFNSQANNAKLASDLKREDISMEERKKLLTQRVVEIEKRITALSEKLVDRDAETTTPASFIETQIQLYEQQINTLISDDMMIDEAMKNQQNQQVA
jgi:hypothetical protein